MNANFVAIGEPLSYIWSQSSCSQVFKQMVIWCSIRR